MQKALELWSAKNHWEAANLFERIAQAEPDNWLPPYYVAKINVIYSFGEKDETKLTAQLGKARDFLNDAMAISKDNPEIMVVEAQLYTAWVAFDGQRYGMQYAGKVAQIYQEAYKISPDNPRVVLGKAEWDMGSAQFFGQPVDAFCKDITKAIELFSTFEPVSKFHPKGGIDRAKQVQETSCNKD
jgi:tetratricopeptide (TPR) repeat protein